MTKVRDLTANSGISNKGKLGMAKDKPLEKLHKLRSILCEPHSTAEIKPSEQSALNLSPNEMKLLRAFHRMNEQEKQLALAYVKHFAPQARPALRVTGLRLIQGGA